MLLSRIRVKNFRSLEDVTIEGLSEVNVFIGRNSSGKSTILNALQHLSRIFLGSPNQHLMGEPISLLTNHEGSRALEYSLEFRPTDTERNTFIDLIVEAGYPPCRQASLLQSAFLRRIRFEFKGTPGNPMWIDLDQVRVEAQDAQWAEVISRRQDDVSGINHITPMTFDKRFIVNIGELAAKTLDNTQSPRPYTILHLRQKADYRDAGASNVNLWMLPQLSEYLTKTFFFNSYRHSSSIAYAGANDQLASDGNNLPAVLNYLSGKSRSKFQQIEDFVLEALRGPGLLHSGLVPIEAGGVPTPQQVEITFEANSKIDVRLSEMGGGVEQLLMVATALATEPEGATLFLEEPELHLHAGAQRFLIEQLRKSSRQVFITSHSPVFINRIQGGSLYRVQMTNGRTIVHLASDSATQADVLREIGARNSDLLLSDAVLFVEGPTDRDILNTWALTLGLNLEEMNISILPMGGGRRAETHAPARSEVLAGISLTAPVPHKFLLDKDERSEQEIENLRKRLGERIVLTQSREIENCLLVPRVILLALQEKYADDRIIATRVATTSEAEVSQLIDEAIDKQYGAVLLKRVKAQIGGLKDGFVTNDIIDTLISQAANDKLPVLLEAAVTKQLLARLDEIQISKTVATIATELAKEWADADKRVMLAPGTEVLEAVFGQFGGRFNKQKDSLRIARYMTRDELPSEIVVVLESLRETPGGQSR